MIDQSIDFAKEYYRDDSEKSETTIQCLKSFQKVMKGLSEAKKKIRKKVIKKTKRHKAV
jgi:hypothetical protein